MDAVTRRTTLRLVQAALHRLYDEAAGDDDLRCLICAIGQLADVLTAVEVRVRTPEDHVDLHAVDRRFPS